MRQIALIAVLIVGCLGTFAQERIDPEDKALFEQLSNDSTFKIIQRRFKPIDLAASNAYKQELYMASLNKTPNIVKIFKREQVGREGQYTKTYFIVDHGKAKIVEAYFGDPSGSNKLRYIHVYAPEELKLGYLDKDWKFIPLSNGEVPKDKELFIGYRVAPRQETRRF
jgi:hypothetical protein